MDSATAGDEVVLAAGTYSWNTQTTHPYTMVIVKRGVSVRGEAGAAATTLDAEDIGRVLLCEDVGTITVSGITIHRGASKDPTHFLGGGGGYVRGESNVTFSDCHFRNNLGWLGGGLLTESDVTLRSCEFSDNISIQEGGGGAFHARASSTVFIHTCRFLRNGAHGHGSAGGAIHAVGPCRISSSWFEGNYAQGALGASGGGISCWDSIEITGSTFVENTTRAVSGNAVGGAIAARGPTTIRDCVFIANLAQGDAPSSGWGAALYASSAAVLDISQCTIVGNRATGGDPGGGIVVQSSVSGTISACIFARNDGYALHARPIAAECNVFFGNGQSDHFVAVDNGGNLVTDPQFCAVDPLLSYNVELQQDSPCAPGNHPDGGVCQLIGAAPVGCNAVSVETKTWSDVKQTYRR
jgi:hypothetical protein